MQTKDRRTFLRWDINKPAKLKLDTTNYYINCVINDINFSGARITLSAHLSQDKFLKMKIKLAEDFIIDVEAWVVWHKRVMDSNAYGLYFTKISDKDKEKIYKFVYRSFPSQRDKLLLQTIQKGGETMQVDEPSKEGEFNDRRIFNRLPVKFPVRFIGLNFNKEGLAESQDISAKGVGITTSERLEPKAALELWLKFPDKGEPLYTRGTVVWSKAIETNEYRTGINLERADLMGISRVLRAA
jgi:hypothetical protein